jgi:hypothetical protein
MTANTFKQMIKSLVFNRCCVCTYGPVRAMSSVVVVQWCSGSRHGCNDGKH